MQVPTAAARRRGEEPGHRHFFLRASIHPRIVLSPAHQPAAASARSLLPTPAAAAELHGRPRGSCRAAWGSARRLRGARPAARRSRSRGATGVDLGTASWNAGGPDRGVQGSAPGDMWPLGHEPRQIGAVDFVFSESAPLGFLIRHKHHHQPDKIPSMMSAKKIPSIKCWANYVCVYKYNLRCSKRSLFLFF